MHMIRTSDVDWSVQHAKTRGFEQQAKSRISTVDKFTDTDGDTLGSKML